MTAAGGQYGLARRILYSGGVEIPSDYAGVLYEEFDSKGMWRFRLAAEIKAAGIDVDLNKAV